MWGSSRFFARRKRENAEPMDSGLHIDRPKDLQPRLTYYATHGGGADKNYLSLRVPTYCANYCNYATIRRSFLVTHTRFALRDCELRVRRLNYLTNAPDMSGLILRCYRSKHRYTKYRGVTHCISLCPRRCGGGWFCGLPTRVNRRKRNRSVCGCLHHNNIHNNSS